MNTRVEALLRAHEAADAREADVRARCLELSRQRLAWRRDHFVPGHFTVSAFIVDDAGRLVLVHHRKLVRWLQPGGHFEAGDTDPVAAARREAHEETGLSDLRLLAGPTLLDLDIHAIPAHGEQPGHHHFDLRFGFRAPDGASLSTGDAGVSEVRWWPMDRLSSALASQGHECDASVQRAVRSIRARTAPHS